jgi:hypothetical protein
MLDCVPDLIVGDLIELRESLPFYPYKKNSFNIENIDFKCIFESSPHLDDDFSGWVLSGEKLLLLDIVYLEDIPMIYECLLKKEIVYLFKTEKMNPEICFIKCKS